jgi:hypothetical protein
MTAVTMIATIPVLGQERPAVSGFAEDEEGAGVIGAFVDSLKLLMIEHSFRIAFQRRRGAS